MNATSDATTALAAVGGVFAALYAAHMVGDHWVQTDTEARAKGGAGWAGRWADTRHVASLTLTKVLSIVALIFATGVRFSPWHLVLGLAVDAGSHWWADRAADSGRCDRPDPTLRSLALLAERTGKARFYRVGVPRAGHDDLGCTGTGAYLLDQSWHIGWLFITALTIGSGVTS